jgi:transposase
LFEEFNWKYPNVLVVSEEPSGGSENVTPARSERSDAVSFPRHANQVLEMKLKLARATDALAELYELLEKYAPTWYTQRHHEKAASTLRLVKKV